MILDICPLAWMLISFNVFLYVTYYNRVNPILAYVKWDVSSYIHFLMTFVMQKVVGSLIVGE